MNEILILLLFMTAVGVSNEDPSRDGPRPGSWSIAGKDTRQWQGVLTLESTTRNAFNGCVEWKSLDAPVASGLEEVVGDYIPETREFRMQGIQLLDAAENLAQGASYRAWVNTDGRLVYGGRWFGEEVEDGVWSARHEKTEATDACREWHRRHAKP
jgi:hypothetical protein